ncbi:MAG TPA: two-component regulator propeller domain-containing protein [Candidatus Sulfopaludibacter sp.]|jgi:PAS domain S-box-containing protein|nr:two-component regulator propeller domain-containing protein [Candidatus Sulfopaludibacter sp.]
MGHHHHRPALIFWLAGLILQMNGPAAASSAAEIGARPLPARSEYIAEVWDTDRGMPSSATTSITSTRDGYLWIGTFEGLVRFDGARFTVINHYNTPDFPDDAVTAVFVDHSGRLWAGTAKGIVARDRDKWTVYPRQDGLQRPLPTVITEDPGGAILAVCGNRFYRLTGSAFAAVSAPPQTSFFKVYPTTGGELWGSAQGFFGRYREGRWESVAVPPDLPDGPLTTASSGTAGIWVAGPDSVRKYEDGRWSKALKAPAGFRFSAPLKMIEDSAGNVWVGDYRRGLVQFRKDGASAVFGQREGIPNLSIRGLYEDPERNIWMGTDGGGLVRLRHRSAMMFEESQGLTQTVIDSVSEGAPGSLLLGTYGGGLQLFDEAAQHFQPPMTSGTDLLPTSLVLTALRDRSGTVWVSELGRGLVRIDGGKSRRLNDGPPGGWTVRALFIDSHQTMWIGHEAGIASYATGQLVTHTSEPGAPRKDIVAIAEDVHGDLWFGGSEGLFRLRNGKFEKYLPPHFSEYGDITALYADAGGTLWIGAHDRGLDRLRDGVFTGYGAAQGLVAMRVGSILEDNLGRLWLATARQGLVCVTRGSLDTVAAGGRAQLELVWLTRGEGLATNQLRGGYQPAAWKAGSGKLWFATLKGLAMVDPAAVKAQPWFAPIRVEGVTMAGRRISGEALDGTLIVPPGSRRLQFFFTAPSLSEAEHVRFQYRLEGLDPNWLDTTERSASVGDLDPGDYTFRVRATDNEGVWSGRETALKIHVQPFYWETLWFRLIAATVLAVISSLVVYASQSRKLRRKSEQLEKEQALRRDIERMQEGLKTSEERFAKAFNASPIPMSINSLTDGSFLDVNQRFLERTGLQREQVIGRRRRDLKLWIDGAEADRFAEEVRSRHRARNFEARIWDPRGQPSYHLLSAETIELNGEPCVLVASDEITERKQLQEQLNQAQKLESIGRLAGGVAHDFNNLLTVINGYSDLILQRMDGADRNWSRVDQIRKAGDRAAELTGQLLAFSRKQVIKPEPIDLNHLIRETQPMLRRLLPENIDLAAELSSSPACVLADPGQLHQVLINLAVNARDAMPDGGSLTVETSVVELDEEYARTHPGVSVGSHVLMALSDTGQGMSEEVCKHVFEPFYTTKKKGSGTGLGLATVYGIVRQSGGHIWVYSEPAKGATFKIYLPRIEPAGAPAEKAAAAAQSYRGQETVLLVEDQENVRQLAREVLESYGYHVLEADHGAAALQLADTFQGAIDLLLTDVVMPGMTGKELASRMKLRRPATKVLYMSGYTANVIVKQGVLDAGISFIPKPLTAELLAAKVREVLGPAETK